MHRDIPVSASESGSRWARTAGPPKEINCQRARAGKTEGRNWKIKRWGHVTENAAWRAGKSGTRGPHIKRRGNHRTATQSRIKGSTDYSLEHEITLHKDTIRELKDDKERLRQQNEVFTARLLPPPKKPILLRIREKFTRTASGWMERRWLIRK